MHISLLAIVLREYLKTQYFYFYYYYYFLFFIYFFEKKAQEINLKKSKKCCEKPQGAYSPCKPSNIND